MTQLRFKEVFAKGRKRIGVGQAEMGRALGITSRSVWRWEHQGGSPDREHLRALVRFVDKRDPKLGDEIIASLGHTRLELELVPVVDAVPRAPAPAPATATSPAHLRLFADALVCTIAESIDQSPRLVRSAVLSLLERIEEAKLPVAAIVAAMRASEPDTTPG